MKHSAVMLRLVVAAGLSFGLSLGLGSAGATAMEPTREDLEARLAMALQIARERNDPELVAQVQQTGRAVVRGAAADAALAEADRRVREVEAAVGIQPGGWVMAGQPLFRPTPELKAAQAEMGAKLAAAMRTADAGTVRQVMAEMIGTLGVQAGVPDGRGQGRQAQPRSVGAAEAAHLMVKGMGQQARAMRQLAAGRPLPDQMVRLYADILSGLTLIRPAMAAHEPEFLPQVDALADGAASVLLGLQQPAGHFPFPDLRGKNIRFGDMITRQTKAGKVEVKDGWVITADPEGGTQFDTGVCGQALLIAGRLRGREAWVKAGLRAADWALQQPCCANFNYNAFSVSLLAEAFRATGETRYLDGALAKFRVGVAPGQAPNGRWADPHNARTVYHVIILRALGDLAAALPPQRTTERQEVEAVRVPAVKALLDEFDAMGMTVEALPELQVQAALDPADTRTRAAVRAMAGFVYEKCTDGQNVKLGAALRQIAALAEGD